MSQDVSGWPAAGATDSPPYQWRWLAFGVVLLASMMDLLDALVSNIAGPSIREGIGGGTTLLQWLGASYTLAMFVGLMTGGRLGDIYGRKAVFLVGATGFTISSILCSTATGPGMLIAFRALQGLFGAVMLPQTFGIIREVFPPREMAAAFGAFGPAMGLATVAGPTVAGALIDADLFGAGWRMIFLINAPLGLLAILGAVRFVPSSGTRSATRLDPVGVLLVSVAALLMIFPVVQGRERDWPAWAFVSMGVSVLFFVLFGWHQVRRERHDAEPLVTPGLFRKRAFVGGLGAGLTFFTAIVGFSLVLTVYLQVGLGFSPLKAGLTVLPQAIGSVFGFIAAGAGLASKLGRRLLQAGALIIVVGVVGVFLTLRAVDGAVSPYQLIPALGATGIGLGLVLAPFFDIVLAGVEQHETGSASGTLNAMQQFGSSLGLAVTGTVFFGLLTTQVTASTDDLSPRLRTELAAAGVSDADQDRVLADLRACGQDSTQSQDPTVEPASCGRLANTVGVLAGSADDGQRVVDAVTGARIEAGRTGMDQAIERTLWVVVALQVLTFLLAFLLPARAREREEWSPSGAPEESPPGAIAPA